MATKGTPPPTFDNADLMSYVVRMVTPMRREFSRSLDVSHFLRDFAYAKEIINQAKSSKDARLCEYALYLESKLTRLRNPSDEQAAARPKTTAGAPLQTDLGVSTSQDSDAAQTEAEMRKLMMNKYTGGLR